MHLPTFPNVDLFSAGINALNGVLVARNPSHDRGYSMAGLLIMAFFGGIGGAYRATSCSTTYPHRSRIRSIFLCVF